MERAWTAQEVILASKALLVTGSYAMDWERFRAGINFGLRAGIIDAVVLGLLVDPVILPYLSTNGLHNEWFMSPVIVEDIAKALAQRLFALLVHSRARHATDPRDKIYAYLGLVSVDHSVPSFLGIKPDYVANVANVYQDAAQKIMFHSVSLDTLGACLPRTTTELPTWVPVWNNAGPSPRPLMYDTFGALRASQVSYANPRAPVFTHIGQKLVLSGHHITSVQSLSRVLPRPILNQNDYRKVIPGGLSHYWPVPVANTLLFLPALLMGCWRTYRLLLKIVAQLTVLTELEEFAQKRIPLNPLVPQSTDGYDTLFVYWRTISAGAGVAKSLSEGSQLFHAWHAEHRLIFLMCALRIHRVFPSLILITYLRTTWSHFNAFMPYLEMAYKRSVINQAS